MVWIKFGAIGRLRLKGFSWKMCDGRWALIAVQGSSPFAFKWRGAGPLKSEDIMAFWIYI
jgi:hypothetical protein